MSSTQLRQFTNESEPGVILRYDNVLGEASEAGIVTPIPNNIAKEDFQQLQIFVKLTEKNKRSGAGSLTMIVQNGKYPELEFHRATRYTELKALARKIEKQKHGEEVVLAFPGSFCDKTSTLTENCTNARTTHIEQYFENVINVYIEHGWTGTDEFLEFLQEKKKWEVQERNTRSGGGGKKTRKRNRKRGKKTSKRKRKGKRKHRKRKKSLKKRRRGRKRTKRRR